MRVLSSKCREREREDGKEERSGVKEGKTDKQQ